MLPRSLLPCWISALLILLACLPSHAADSFFKPGDVVAYVGGEDMVAAAECGYLETLLTRAYPDLKMKFRSLAWEGDTVYEQRRDLNYPTLEQQLDQVGATVVIAQFGAMESMDGGARIPEFTTAYERLLDRLGKNGMRRVALISPSLFGQSVTLPVASNLKKNAAFSARDEATRRYAEAISALAKRRSSTCLDNVDPRLDAEGPQRDGVHLTDGGHWHAAQTFGRQLGISEVSLLPAGLWQSNTAPAQREMQLLTLIRAKNRLWFNYYRPQNWAFLAGDRTNQPSSRDHLDPSKRWFPAELEQFIPLIEAKEAEIAVLVKEMSK